MARRTTPRSTKIVASAVLGALAAVTIGQHVSAWALASQAHTLVIVAAGAGVAGLIGWFATRDG